MWNGMEQHDLVTVYLDESVTVKVTRREFGNQSIIVKKTGCSVSEQWLTVEIVAKELGLSEDTIRNYIKAKQLPAVKFGNTYRISRKDLDKFIEERRTKKDE
jgi:excisionase family DNA binding protein